MKTSELKLVVLVLLARIIAFFVGLILLAFGLIDLVRLGELFLFFIFNFISIPLTAILKVIFGVFLVATGINPDIIRKLLQSMRIENA